MSDNHASQEMRRLLIIFLRIPNETWTDVLKMLPRRILFQKIAPVCYRLKEIGDKNVKSIHMIENADEFDKKLAENDPEAVQQVKHLAGNKCNLAEYFRLTKLRISDEKIKAVLHHSMDLLRGCKITLDADYRWNMSFYDTSLSILGSIKPIVIRFGRRLNSINHYWIHPTVRSCNRLVIGYESTAVKFVFEWLHHKPMNMDDSAVDHVRCMIGFRIGIWTNQEIEWLLNRCIENLKQGRTPADRRQFVLSFVVWVGAADQLENKRLQNHMTGEVLVFRRVMPEVEDNTTDITTTFRCRRCLADKEAGDGAEEFYAKVFKPNNGGDQFNMEEVKAEVLIDT